MLIDLEQPHSLDLEAGIQRWEHFPASRLSHHGKPCCDIAREWLVGMDFSQLNGGNVLTGPRWLRHKFKWGPSQWPLHWCEAVQKKTLDCGALAALSHELLLARGVRSFPAQFILEFNEISSRHWQETWSRENSCAHWISNGLIYHEGCAVAVRGDEIRLWDATATWWINPKQFGGYAGLLAVRVFAAEGGRQFTWGSHPIAANTWNKIARAKGDFAKPERPARKRRARVRAKAAAPAAIV
jgi:hypothetical protein